MPNTYAERRQTPLLHYESEEVMDANMGRAGKLDKARVVARSMRNDCLPSSLADVPGEAVREPEHQGWHQKVRGQHSLPLRNGRGQP